MAFRILPGSLILLVAMGIAAADGHVAAVNAVSGQDFSRFFERHIIGTGGNLAAPDTLRKAGIDSFQFADEFYLRRLPDARPSQQAIFEGLTHSGRSASR